MWPEPTLFILALFKDNVADQLQYAIFQFKSQKIVFQKIFTEEKKIKAIIICRPKLFFIID
jgi:hypothetical protein